MYCWSIALHSCYSLYIFKGEEQKKHKDFSHIWQKHLDFLLDFFEKYLGSGDTRLGLRRSTPQQQSNMVVVVWWFGAALQPQDVDWICSVSPGEPLFLVSVADHLWAESQTRFWWYERAPPPRATISVEMSKLFLDRFPLSGVFVYTFVLANLMHESDPSLCEFSLCLITAGGGAARKKWGRVGASG